MLSTRVRNAPLIWNNLNGIINVYKPAGVKISHLKNTIKHNLTRDLNLMENREPRKLLKIESKTNENYIVQIETDLSDHVLAVGPRYQIEDVHCNIATNLGLNTSGVLLLGINKGTKEAYKLSTNKLLRAYHVTGQFGTCTEDNFKYSRVISRATYKHVWPDRMSALLSSMEASHQKKMYELCGVNLQSQAAYDIAVQGLIRPANNVLPVVYGIRCVSFQRPMFTIEVHAINEDETYLCQLVQEIGIQLHTAAHCSGIRCIRQGHFKVDDSLLRNNWSLQGVLTNIECNRRLLDKYPTMLKQTDGLLSSGVTSS